MSMTLDKATSFLRMLQNGQIDRRPIGEWIGLREACGVILAHLTQPAQSVDVADVRTLLECIEGEHGGDHFEADCRHCAAFDRLTAALQEKGNG